MADSAQRPLRADARRDRDKILAAAVRGFAEEGLDPHLERIAQQAGAGSAPLYRDFPAREVPIEAVHRNEVAQLCSAVSDLLAAHPPCAALRAVAALTDACVAEGAARTDFGTAELGAAGLGPADVGTALESIARTPASPEPRQRAERLLGLTLDGLKARR